MKLINTPARIKRSFSVASSIRVIDAYKYRANLFETMPGNMPFARTEEVFSLHIWV